MTRPDWIEQTWKPSDAAVLVEELARRSGLGASDAELPACDAVTAGRLLGLEAEADRLSSPRLERTLLESAPAVLQLANGLVGLLQSKRERVQVLLPDLRTKWVPMGVLQEKLLRAAAAEKWAEAEKLADRANLKGAKRRRAVEALVRGRVEHATLAKIVALRQSPGSNFLTQMRQAGLLGKLAVFLGAHLAEFGCLIGAWWLAGQGILAGRVDEGWLLGWAMLLVSMAPLRVATVWAQGRFALGLGGLLRQRLLEGALRLERDNLRTEGAGQLLGRVLEGETLEGLALSGGMSAAMGMVESVAVVAILLSGASAWLAAAYAGWVALAIWMGARYAAARLGWTRTRLALTNHQVEVMVGHRTRLSQQAPEDWHLEEDRQMTEYVDESRRMDRWQVGLLGTIPRGWLVLGLIGLAPAFIGTAGPELQVLLAVSLGGLLMGMRSLQALVTGMSAMAGAWVSWGRVAPLFRAASEEEPAGAGLVHGEGGSQVVLEARQVDYRYEGRGEPVLCGVNMRLLRGDRVLLEGDSGGGKSTLTALLCGLRQPGGGLVLASGLDMRTLGAAEWRRRIAAAPQYHDNHVLSASFAFNLLMGRQWPPSNADVKEAEQVCGELGLGPLLARMPGGLWQMVGETGWQLSQGERSRLFLARALLSGADVVILDESFAALDPGTLEQAMACALRRARTLVVVAHP